MNPRAENERVIVVGAGPVGLVTALLLAEAEIPVLVLEAGDAVEDDLRASTFHPPTLDLLAPYGVSRELVAQGLVCPAWQIRMHGTGERVVFDMSVLAGDTEHPYRLQCEQSKLVENLARRLAGDRQVELRFGHRAVGVGQDEDRAWVEVETDDPAGPQRLDGRFVVGADGANSAVRQGLGLDFGGKTYPETTVLVSTPFDFSRHIEDLSNVTYGWKADGNFALLRLRDFWRCSLYYDPDLSFEQATSDPRIQAQLRAIVPAPEPFEVLDRRPYRVHQRIVRDYRVGRFLLAGDSAHLNSPSGGLGMNGGIHDAFNLVAKLEAVWHGGDIALLDRYTRQRRSTAERGILAQADRNRKRMTEKDPARRLASLRELQRTADDRERLRDFLLSSSMITGLRQEEAIA